MRRRPLLATAATAWLWPLRASRAGAPDLVIGQFAPMSGPLASRLAAFNAGARLVFDAINDAGGLRGRRLRWESVDDHGRPEESVAATRGFLQQQACALFGCVGNDATLASLKLLRQAGVPALAGMEVGDGVRLEGSRVAYFVRAGLGREAEAIARHCASQQLGGVAILHEPGPAGGELLRLLGDACAARQLRVLGSAAVTSDPGVAQEAARKLAALAPQALLLAVPGRLAGAVLSAAQTLGQLLPTFGLSFVAEDGHVLRLGGRGRTLAIAQVMPNPLGTQDPLLVDYRRQASDKRVPVGYASLEGWLSAQVLAEALHRCGRDVGPQRLRSTLDTLKITLAGLDVDFSRHELAGSRFVELMGVTPEGHWRSLT